MSELPFSRLVSSIPSRLLAVTLACAGCGTSTTSSDDAATGTDDVEAGDGTGDTSSGDTAANTLLANGDYYLMVNVVPFGGVRLPFKATITAHGSLTAGGTIDTFELFAVSEKETPVYVSESIALIKGAAVSMGGAVTLESADVVTIPDKASPTGSALHIANFKLSGSISADGTFCGGMSGTVVEFAKDIATSTFKAAPWGKQGDVPEASCTAAVVKHYKPIEKCPSLKIGVNEITSAERKRRFTLYLPNAATGTDLPPDVTSANLPLTFLYHGVGGDMGGILGDTGYDKLVQNQKFALVVPESERDANGKAVSQTEWAYGLEAFADDNQDLVFFDDMRKCLAEQIKFDAKRVYVTGMSGGGMMTVFTSFARSDVIAAAAPFSGGYLFKFPSTKNKFPELVTWGGQGDTAYGQNFDVFAKALIPFLVSDGHLVVQCDHGTGHKWPAAMTQFSWGFLSRFVLGEPVPAPTAEDLKNFPSYCSLAK